MAQEDLGRTRFESSKTDPFDKNQQSILLLQRTMMMFRGHAPVMHLGEIHRTAVEKSGFEGSLEEAAGLLAEMPKVHVELDPALAQSRVYASVYWSPMS